MYDVLPVSSIECIRYFYRDTKCLLEWKRTALQALRQRLTFQIFHDQELLVVVFTNIVERADVRMIQAGNGLRFAFESLLAHRIIGHFFRQDFDCH